MSTKNDGGPAFPQPACPDCGVQHAPQHVPGMSVRDVFAALAMAGALGGVPGRHLHPDQLSVDSYAHADAMLKAREQE